MILGQSFPNSSIPWKKTNSILLPTQILEMTHASTKPKQFKLWTKKGNSLTKNARSVYKYSKIKKDCWNVTINSVSLAFINGLAHPLFALVVGLNSKRLLKKIRKLPKYKSMRSRSTARIAIHVEA